MTCALVVFTAAAVAAISVLGGAEGACSTLTTFNAALLPRTDGYDERRQLFPQAVIDEDADFVCLQEVWFERDIHNLIAATQHVYPYHYSKLHSEVSDEPDARKRLFPETSCSVPDALYFYSTIFPCGLLNGCLQQFQLSFALGLSCATSRCPQFFNSKHIRPQCITCIALTATSITNLLGGCTTEFYGRDNRLNEAGLVILSKKPLTNVAHTSYFPESRMTLPRAYIHAEVEDLPPVICTHFTALFDVYFEYNISLQNYTAQQEEEIRIANAIYGTETHILTGDLNTGPTRPTAVGEQNIQGEGPEQYDMLLDLGYRSPYMEQDASCTYCASNILVSGNDSNAIDHVMLMSGSAFNVQAKRVLDGLYGEMPLSDHYGVRANICDNNP